MSKITTCRACYGEGIIHTGIDESPTTICGKCDGVGDISLAAPAVANVQHDSDCSTNNRGVPELLGPCDCSVANGAAELPPLPWHNLEHGHDFEAWLEPLSALDMALIFGDYGRAAIAASTQQAAPKPLTKAQSHALATCVNGGTQMGWISDDDARAILTAAAPNALLVAALKDAIDTLENVEGDRFNVDMDAVSMAISSTRAVLASVPTVPEA